jgi:ribosomal protein S18 acetylase RimI-like enzyme
MSHDIHLRTAYPADSEFVFAVTAAALRDYIEKTWGWDEARARAIHSERFRPAATAIIEWKGEPIGWMVVQRGAEEIYLDEINLLPAYQGRGIGSWLIGQLLAEADRGAVPVRLQVLKVNPAKALYERLAFRVFGETATHYLMRRLPNQPPQPTRSPLVSPASPEVT